METEKPAIQTAATAETPSSTTTQPPGEIVNLDKMRAEQETQIRGDAQAIVDFCAVAGMPDLAGGFIAQGLSLESVRKELLSKRAESPEIQSSVMPGDGTRVNTQANPDSNPLVQACVRLAKQNKGM